MNQSRRTDPPAGESTGQRIIAGVLRTVLRLTLGRAFQAGSPIERQRRRLLQATRLTFPPRDSSFATGVCGGVAGEWVSARARGQAAARTILYLHGGGYVAGSPRTHRVITGHLAASCGARVFAADYRLAPELPFPAALDDAVAAYRGLLAEGIAAGDIVIAGDSAGGGLSVATALRLRELEQPLPRALVLFSPWIDLSLEQLPDAPPGEVMLTPEWMAEGARAYRARTDARHPLVSPVFADLHGLPPTLVQVGTDELLLGDSHRLHERLRAAGVAVRIEEYPHRWHVFQASAGVLADADRAIESVARFIRDGGPSTPG